MIHPLGIHVLVEPLEVSTTIVMPEQSKGQAERGVVLGLGSQVDDADLNLEVGMTVIYRKYSPEEFEMDGKTVYLIEESDLMGYET
jgi:chaperonin GroES